MIILGVCNKLLCCVICSTVLINTGNVVVEEETEITPYEEISESTDEEIIEEPINFIKPVMQGILTSKYGMRNGRMHSGLDIADKTNTNLYASCDGEVVFAGWGQGYGNLIKIQHKDGYQTYYGHCNKILVKKGDIVKQGDLIGKMGMTGNATGPHVHFEIRLNGETINPYNYIY